MKKMKFKIIKCSDEKWWYKDSIGKEFDFDVDVNNIIKTHIEIVDNTEYECVYFESNTGVLFSILIKDINYNSTIRKQKLEKICLSQVIN